MDPTTVERFFEELVESGPLFPAAGHAGVVIGRNSLLACVGGGDANGRLRTPPGLVMSLAPRGRGAIPDNLETLAQAAGGSAPALHRLCTGSAPALHHGQHPKSTGPGSPRPQPGRKRGQPVPLPRRRPRSEWLRGMLTGERQPPAAFRDRRFDPRRSGPASEPGSGGQGRRQFALPSGFHC